MYLCPAHRSVGLGGPRSSLVRRLGGRPELALFVAAYLVYTAARWIFVGDLAEAREHAYRIVETRALRGRGDRRIDPARAGARRRELAAEQHLPGRAARRPAGRADLAVSPLAADLPPAAHDGDRDLADRRADLRAVSRRASAPGGDRHHRHGQQRGRRRADRPLDRLLQPVRRRSEPARRLRLCDRHRRGRRSARPVGEDRGAGGGGPVVTLSVLVTGNHYVFDAAAGLLVTGLGFAGGRLATRRARPASEPVAA